MPLYTSSCSGCGERHSYVRSVAERALTPECCGRPTDKVIDMPQIGAMAFAGAKGFVAHATETPQWLETGTDVKRYMKQHGLVPTHEAAQEARIRRDARDVETDRKLDSAIHKARTELGT